MATRALLLGAILAALLIPTAGSAGLRTAPQNTGQPVVSGRTVQGQILRTSQGRWNGTSPLAFRYRWLRCDASGGGANGVTCTTIPGETRRALVLRPAHLGHRIRPRPVASHAAGPPTAESKPTP